MVDRAFDEPAASVVTDVPFEAARSSRARASIGMAERRAKQIGVSDRECGSGIFVHLTKVSLNPAFRQFVQCYRLFDRKEPDASPAKTGKIAASIQRSSKIASERPDVSAAATID